jgi:hypothetical protein
MNGSFGALGMGSSWLSRHIRGVPAHFGGEELSRLGMRSLPDMGLLDPQRSISGSATKKRHASTSISRRLYPEYRIHLISLEKLAS